jgi:hypothetical protein
MILATLIEGKELLQTVVASTVAGIGVTVAFSIAIWGVAQFAELSRAERSLAAGFAGAVGVLALVAVVAAVVVGVIVMTSS